MIGDNDDAGSLPANLPGEASTGVAECVVGPNTPKIRSVRRQQRLSQSLSPLPAVGGQQEDQLVKAWLAKKDITEQHEAYGRMFYSAVIRAKAKAGDG